MGMRLRAADAGAPSAPGISGWRWRAPDPAPPTAPAAQSAWWVEQAPTADPATYLTAPLPDALRLQGAAVALVRARADVMGALDRDAQIAVMRARARVRRWELRTSPFVVWLLGAPRGIDPRTQAATSLLEGFAAQANARAGAHYATWEQSLREGAQRAAAPSGAAAIAQDVPDGATTGATTGAARPLTLAAVSHIIQQARHGVAPDAGTRDAAAEPTVIAAAEMTVDPDALTQVPDPGAGHDPPPPERGKGPHAKPSALDADQVAAGREGVARAVRMLQGWTKFDDFGRQEAVLNGLIAERARLALAAGDPAWVDHLQQVLSEQQILTGRYGDADCRGLVEWCRRDPVTAGRAFRTLWEGEDLEAALDGFCATVPLDKEELGNNSLAQVASILVSGRDPYNLPPLQAHSTDLARICGLPTIATSAPVGRRYALMLDNLRALREDLAGRGVPVRDLAGMYGVSVYVGNPRFLDYDTAPAGEDFDDLYRDLVALHRANGGRRFPDSQSERNPAVRRGAGA